MLKKTIVIILSVLLICSSFLLVSAASSAVLHLGDSSLELLDGTLIRNGEYFDGRTGVSTSDENSLFLTFKVSSFSTYPCESYAVFQFSGYNYGVLTLTLSINSGVPIESNGGFILVNSKPISNYNYIVSDNKYIFTITGEIPQNFEVGGVFTGVVPGGIDEPMVVTMYSNASFIPDYSNISQDIIDNQNQNTQDIINNQNQLQQNEKDEAEISGNDGVNSIVGGIENKGEGFFNSMGNLISVMSYNGTDCKWNLPPITLPKINGVMDSITLTDDLEIDFEYWIAQIPTTIMRVVRAILTIALILFCVKELYSVLSYVFTLRGG